MLISTESGSDCSDYRYLVEIPEDRNFEDFVASDIKLPSGVYPYTEFPFIGFKSEKTIRAFSNCCFSILVDRKHSSLISDSSLIRKHANGFILKTHISIWHGETDIATYQTDSGEYLLQSETYPLANMFDDENSDTMWHSHQDNANTVGVSATINLTIIYEA